jgi:hypothetical protein
MMPRPKPWIVLPLALAAACQHSRPASRLDATPRHDEWVEVRRVTSFT